MTNGTKKTKNQFKWYNSFWLMFIAGAILEQWSINAGNDARLPDSIRLIAMGGIILGFAMTIWAIGIGIRKLYLKARYKRPL